MVAENSYRAQPAMRNMCQHTPQLIELALVAIADPVTGKNHKIGRLVLRPPERLDDVVIVHQRSYMCVSNLSQCPAMKLRRQTANGQYGMGEFQPMRLPSPGIKPGGNCAGPGTQK